MAAGLLLLLVAAALLLAQLVETGIGGGPLTATGAAGSVSPAGAAVWVVHPGDTLWSIASTVEPGADERPLVDRLSAEVGNRPLYPGEVLALPVADGQPNR